MPAPTGNPIPLGYGYVWGTGQKIQGTTLQNTGDSTRDYTRIGGWVLGQDEWDGLEELWDKTLNRLLFTNELGSVLQVPGASFDLNSGSLHYHRGCDAVIGGGLAPTSVGPDQGVDSFFQYLPAGVQPLTYNRQSSFWLMMKNFVNNPENDHQNNASNFADLDPIGLWRGLRVRIFDATGAMTAYAFTTNPAWQICDVLLRMRLFPEYSLDVANGPDDLTEAVRRKVDWPAMADAAASFDRINAQLRKSYETSWLFTNPTTLQALLTPMLQACRSYMLDRAGKYSLRFDQERSSVFTISRKNVQSFVPDDKDLHTAGNRFVAQFRDLLVPAINGTIASISYPDHSQPTVTMNEPHPLAAGDRIVIGGTNTTYDTYWLVDTVPAGDAPTSFTLKSRGSNYPASVGPGGYVGLSYSRFKERSPEWNHHRNQMARGAAGVGLPRQRNKLKTQLDFGTVTFDQASRIARYERDRTLGMDNAPYQPPAVASVEIDPYAQDAAGTGNKPIGFDPGDVITVDETASVPYAGLYEILGPINTTPDTVQGNVAQAGRIAFKVATFNPNYMYDESDPTEAGWVDVPGSDPGNGSDGTVIDLQDGQADFYTGIAASGDTLPLPVGYAASSFMGWAAAAGFVEANHQLHVFRNCDFAPVSRILSCIYSDGNDPASNLWTGDNSYAGLASRSVHSVATSVIGAVSFKQLTLAGGEQIVFGSGLVSGTGSFTVQLPDGYTLAKSVCLAFVKDGVETGDHNAHGWRAYVDAAGVVRSLYQDGEGHQWTAANVRLFIFAWRNNMGTVTQDSLGWWSTTLSTGKKFASAGFDIYDASLSGSAPPNHPATPLRVVTSGAVPLPVGLSQRTLQAITGPICFNIVDHPTHGVRNCYVDSDLQSLCQFEDGEGNVWAGTAGGFYLLCDNTSGDGTLPIGIEGTAGTSAKPGDVSHLTVSVVTSTSATGVGVTADLSLIGGSPSQAMALTSTPHLYAFDATVGLGVAPGDYSLPVRAINAEGGLANAAIALIVNPPDGAPPFVDDAEIEPISTLVGTRSTTHGWHITYGGHGYTADSTLILDGSENAYPWEPKTVVCSMTLDADGSIIHISGGEGVTWYGPVDFTLTR